MTARRGLALVLLACGLAVIAGGWSRMGADPLRAAAVMAVGVVSVLINVFVLSGGNAAGRAKLVRLAVLAGTVVLIAVGGMWLYLDRIVAPELEARRQRLSRLGEAEAGPWTEHIERVAAARKSLLWLTLAVGVCRVSAAQLMGPRGEAAQRGSGGRVGSGGAA